MDYRHLLYENKLYMEDVAHTADCGLPWGGLRNSALILTGATGLIGSFLVDVIMYKNSKEELNCSVYAISRNAKRAEERFGKYWASEHFNYICEDINEPFSTKQNIVNKAIELDFSDIPPEKNGSSNIYILHLASNTHPVAYATNPIETITANVFGAKYMLDFAHEIGAKRFAFASSNEIYGENRGDVELFDEKYCGYIDSNTMRAGYPESKRCAEALCQAYIKQYGMDIVIPRLTRSYGPTMLDTDTKAISQFIKKGVCKEDIVLKSEGTQYYSYTYVSDAVSGLLYVLLCGECGEAYNISDEKSDIMLKDLAALIAQHVGKRVIFEIPDELERAGYSKATKARLDGTKLKALGWRAGYDIRQGIEKTIDILGNVSSVTQSVSL